MLFITTQTQWCLVYVLVESIKGYFHALVFVDVATGYRWIQGMKTKDQVLNVAKRWYSDIVDLRAKHKLVVFMQDNSAE